MLCGCQSGTTERPDNVASQDEMDGWAAFTFPYGAFLDGGLTDGGRDVEIRRRAAECMESRGWNYTAPTPEAAWPSEPQLWNELVGYRKSFGYGLARQPTVPDDMSTSANSNYEASLSEVEAAAYHRDLGDQTSEDDPGLYGSGSCLDVALQSYLAETPQQSSSDTAAFAEEQIGRRFADPRFGAAVEAWASCMGDSGYQVRSLGDAFQLASQSPNDELRIAGADVGCFDTHVRDIVVTVDLELISAFVERFPEFGEYEPPSE